ncbi:MAG: RluA family pseudouridine synthase [Spirochaetaceae bacterium]|jgi:23S rRNA pseudouridine1911/1915/1917 synthase|nr:RluA family pseudouridine synthase [Spirochaetaceae bacterium]
MDQLSYSGLVKDLAGEIRLDRYVAEHLRLLSRSQIKNRILEVRVNGKPVKISRLLRAGDALALSWLPQAPVYLEPEHIPLNILYEDRRCVVINKVQGMVVHPGAGNHSGTLANALLWRKFFCRDAAGSREAAASAAGGMAAEAGLRSGIVHRLDKDTSGVLIAAYDDAALAMLSAQFKARTVKKRYTALVQGRFREERGKIRTRLIRDPRDRRRFTILPERAARAGSALVPVPLAGSVPVKAPGKKLRGKLAITYYRVLQSWGNYSLVSLMPKTGRTHQLRVHLKYLGHPSLGDPLYGSGDRSFSGVPLLLHARSLKIVLPEDSEASCFTAPLPGVFKNTLGTLMRR